jgi:hypothetical protein
MSPRSTPRASAAAEAFLSLFGSMRQAIRLQLQSDGGPSTAPMLLRMLQLCQRQPGITQQGLAHLTGRDTGRRGSSDP